MSWMVALRPVGMWVLTVMLRWPWLLPVVAVLLLAGAGKLGVGWLIWTGIGVGLATLAMLLGLAYMGRKARQVHRPPQ